MEHIDEGGWGVAGDTPHLEERGPTGVRKQGTPLGLRFLKACSISLPSEAGSILQNEPLPGSSWDLATLMKYRFRDRLWRIEFWTKQYTFHCHCDVILFQTGTANTV